MSDNITMGTSVLHIETEIECKVFLFDEEKGIATPDKFFNLEVRKGEQDLLFVCTDDEYYKYHLLYYVEELDCDYNIVIEKDYFVSTHELLTAKASDEEIANGIRDEYGVTYSRDGLQLLKRGSSSFSHYQIKQGCRVIRDWAFAFYKGSSISIPSSVTHIGSHALFECKKLTKINIPFSLVHIGEQAFNHTKITSVINESPFFSYENGCLIDVKKKKILSFLSTEYDVTIPTYIKSIGDSAFYNKGISKITLNQGLKSIGEYAFCRCLGLREISLPSSLEHIGYGAFSLSKIKKISNYSTNIEYENGCLIDKQSKSLIAYLLNEKVVEIPEGITHIGSNAFSKYNNPETVIIPEGVTTIEYHAFSECSNLTSITIPSTLKSIGSEAFWLCIQLSKINLPEGIEHVEHDAFLCCGCSTFKIIIPKGTKAYFKTLLSDFEHEKLQEQSESEKP